MTLKSWSDDHLEPAPTTMASSAAISRKQSEAAVVAAAVAAAGGTLPHAAPSGAAAGAISDAIEAALAADSAALGGVAGAESSTNSDPGSTQMLPHGEEEKAHAWVEVSSLPSVLFCLGGLSHGRMWAPPCLTYMRCLLNNVPQLPSLAPWVQGVWFVRSPTGGDSPGDALGAYGEGVQLLAAATVDRTVVLWDFVTGAKVDSWIKLGSPPHRRRSSLGLRKRNRLTEVIVRGYARVTGSLNL